VKSQTALIQIILFYPSFAYDRAGQSLIRNVKKADEYTIFCFFKPKNSGKAYVGQRDGPMPFSFISNLKPICNSLTGGGTL
jgi:hypothetical protein